MNIVVHVKDNTPPQILWVSISGDNIIQVRLYDGSKIQSVKATLILNDNPDKSFEIELNDSGPGYTSGQNIRGNSLNCHGLINYLHH